jgi:hypothetical protein
LSFNIRNFFNAEQLLGELDHVLKMGIVGEGGVQQNEE